MFPTDFRTFTLILSFALLAGCAKSSSDPEISELVTTRQPTFSGLFAKTFIVPTSTNNSVDGECDPISKGIEYSIGNQSRWQTIAGGCPSGTFSVSNISVTPIRRVYIRAKTKTGYTPITVATIQLTIPPSAPLIATTVSSRTDLDGDFGTQNVMSYSFTNDSSSNGAVSARFEAPGINYED